MAFPVAAATCKQHVEARLEKKKTKLEERTANKKIPADKAEAMRAKFAERRAKVNAAVEKAVADGTVTKEEAKEVRKAGGHGHGPKGKKGGQPALARGLPRLQRNTHAVSGESWGPRFRFSLDFGAPGKAWMRRTSCSCQTDQNFM